MGEVEKYWTSWPSRIMPDSVQRRVVLEEDHDAAMAAKDAEMDRLSTRLSARLRGEIDQCAKMGRDLMRMDEEIKSLNRALVEKNHDLGDARDRADWFENLAESRLVLIKELRAKINEAPVESFVDIAADIADEIAKRLRR